MYPEGDQKGGEFEVELGRGRDHSDFNLATWVHAKFTVHRHAFVFAEPMLSNTWKVSIRHQHMLAGSLGEWKFLITTFKVQEWLS